MNTSETGTARPPLRRVTRAARSAVSPRTPRPATHRTHLPGQAPLVPVLAWVLAGFLLGAPEAAQAQTAEVLVSNVGQVVNDRDVLATTNDLAQSFSTGDNQEGYELTSIDLNLVPTIANQTSPPTVKLFRDSTTGGERGAFTGPATIGAGGNITFTTAAVSMGSNTNYWVVAEGGSGGMAWRNTASDAEDATSAADWSIADTSGFRTASSTGTFTSSTSTYLIRVNGTATDTKPPTLASATVNSAGRNIQFRFSEDVGGTTATLPPASAFTVTADGSPVTISAITPTVPATTLLSTVSPSIHQGQTVVVTYTDPTAGDDTNAIQDTAGNDAASFTTGVSGVPAVVNNSTLVTTVPADWSLKPTGLASGGKFRLLFLSSTTRNATATDIADYNTFVQDRAAAGHTDIQAYSAGFRAVGCTADRRRPRQHRHHRHGRPHLLAQRRQGRRRLRGFLRRVLGRRGQRQERVRQPTAPIPPWRPASLRTGCTGCDRHDGTGSSFGRPNSSNANNGPLSTQTSAPCSALGAPSSQHRFGVPDVRPGRDSSATAPGTAPRITG